MADANEGTGGVVRGVLADDFEDARLVTRLILEATGRFEVIGESGHGRGALDLVSTLSPDLLLLDVTMPLLDGLEAIQFVRMESPRTGVVVLSGLEPTDVKTMFDASPADGYVHKSITPDDLVGVLLSITDRLRAQP